MTELDVTKASATNIYSGSDWNIEEYETEAQSLEHGEADEVVVTFPKAAEYFGYYKKYGQLKKAIDTLWLYVVGKGYEVDPETKVILEHITGFGEDTFVSILWNMGVVSMIQGDAFAEIVRDDKTGKLINLKPISPERMRIIYGSNGLIKRYEQVTKDKIIKWNKEEIFHIRNDAIADEQRGTSVIESCKWVIDAIEEARRDYRIVLHRNVVPLRIIEIDTDDTAKRNSLMQEYKDAIQKGEVLVIPKGTVQVTETAINVQDPLGWIQSLENYFYLAVGIPKTIANPEGVSEGTSKIGYLIFEPIYSFRQTLMEADIWNQLYFRIKFNRPASLVDNITTNEAKNTSQLGFQPKDLYVNLNRE